MSSPKTFTARSARTPVTISSIRSLIGCEKANFEPRNGRTSFCISSVSSACVVAFVHCGRGLRLMKMSVSSTPIGSVAISAVPMRDQTWLISSGKARKSACSICVFSSTERSMGVSARRTTLMVRAPSESVGTNSVPRFGAIRPKAMKSTTAAPARTAKRCRMAIRRIGAWMACASRISSGSRSSILAGSSRLASTGISVMDRTIDPASANSTVSAMGRNSLPSTPSSVRIGRYTTMMISSPNRVGLRTSTAASRTISNFVLRVRSPWAMWRTQFSTITTELSTIMPKSMAPRLKRLAAMPKRSMPQKANSIASGMARATMAAARRLPRNKNSTATTSRPASKRFFRTVSMTKSTSSVRS